MLSVQVIGNLGADAEVKESNGHKFVSFKVANTDVYTDSEGVRHEKTQWVSCALNGDGGNLLQYLVKGTKVYVSGRASVRIYDSPTMRAKVASIDINVDRIELCGGSSDQVPRELITEDGVVIPVYKYYWSQSQGGILLHDKLGNSYEQDDNGFIKKAVSRDNTTPMGDTEQQAENNTADSAEKPAKTTNKK